MLFIPSTISAPSTITLVFLSPTFGVDLTTVSHVNLNVRRRDGTATVWSCTIKSSTPIELVAQYQFAGGEITSTGLYTLAPQLTVPGGTFPAMTIAAYVGQDTAKLEDTTWIAATSDVSSAGPVSQAWQSVTASPYAASVISPWLSLDLRTIPISVNLFPGADGNIVILSDTFNAAASHALTLNGAGSDKVPNGDGTFSGTTTRSAPFLLRLKYSAALTSWLLW